MDRSGTLKVAQNNATLGINPHGEGSLFLIPYTRQTGLQTYSEEIKIEKLLPFEKALSCRNILITGHTGFTGSWACLWLKSIGAFTRD